MGCNTPLTTHWVTRAVFSKRSVTNLFEGRSGHQGCSDTRRHHYWHSLREAWRPWRRLCPWNTAGVERHSKLSPMTDRDGWANFCLFFSEDHYCGSEKDRWAVTWADLEYIPCHPSTGHRGGQNDIPEQWGEKTDKSQLLSFLFCFGFFSLREIVI